MDFLTNIHLKKHLLTKKELEACDEILNNLLMVQKLSFTELSENIGVSKPSILRFCKKVGYSGYNEFKYECIKYVNSIHNIHDKSEQSEIDKRTYIAKVTNMYTDVLGLMDQLVDEGEVIKLVKLIKTSTRIRAVGLVNSSLACLQFRYAFLMFGIDIDVISSSEDIRQMELAIKPNDLTIIFSVGAMGDQITKAIDFSKSAGAKIALITMNIESELRDEVDVFITLPSITNLKNESLLNSVPIISVFVEILNVYYNSL